MNNGYQIDQVKEIQLTQDSKIVSGFFTDSNILVLFYLNNNKFIIGSFNENYELQNYIEIGNYKKLSKDMEIFF